MAIAKIRSTDHDKVMDEVLSWADGYVFDEFEITRTGARLFSGDSMEKLAEGLELVRQKSPGRVLLLVLSLEGKKVGQISFMFEEKDDTQELQESLSYWKLKCEYLEKENEELREELESIGDTSEKSIVDKIFDNLKDERVASTLGNMIGMIFNSRNKVIAGVSGVDSVSSDKLIQIVDELKKYDDQLEFHLETLLKIAKSNPALFNMLLSKLNEF